MIDIVMTTYFPPDVPARLGCFEDSMLSLRDYLTSAEPVRLIIADDGSPDNVLDFESYLGRWLGATHLIVSGEHGGIGASLNRAIQHVNDVWMYTTDDWVLFDELCINDAIKLIREHGYDYVRIGYPHSDVPCVTRHHDGIWWLHVNHYQQPGFAFATRPFLASRAFYEVVGPYPEHCNVYDAEIIYANRVRNIKDLRMAFLNLNGYPWMHIGDDAQVGHHA